MVRVPLLLVGLHFDVNFMIVTIRGPWVVMVTCYLCWECRSTRRNISFSMTYIIMTIYDVGPSVVGENGSIRNFTTMSLVVTVSMTPVAPGPLAPWLTDVNSPGRQFCFCDRVDRVPAHVSVGSTGIAYKITRVH